MRASIVFVALSAKALAWGGLPGLMAQDYRKGDLLRVMVSNVSSRTSDKHFDYYDLGH